MYKWAILMELEKAMDSNPDLSVLEVIEYVLDNYRPYRVSNQFNDEQYKIIDKPTNIDILESLKIFNKRV